MLGRNSVAFALRNLGEEDGLPRPLGTADAGTGDEDGDDEVGAPVNETDPVKGVDGRLKPWARGEEGANTGVAGREDR